MGSPKVSQHSNEVRDISRRDFLAQSGSCAAHLALAASVMPRMARMRWAASTPGAVVAHEPFGNLEKVSEGVWALISTPLNGDATTVSNGGIIVGRTAVLAIEGFNKPQGAAWLAGKAKELTGRWPTHVALTHYHADHANGVAGYLTDADHPTVRSTQRTRDLVVERNQPADASRIAAVKDAVLLSATDATSLDLGGRTVRVVPRSGPHGQRRVTGARRSEHRVLRRPILECDVSEFRRCRSDEAVRVGARPASHA